MAENERFLSLNEKVQRSSVIEYASTERTKKTKGSLIKERIVIFRLGTIPFDKVVASVLEVVKRAAGLFYYQRVLIVATSNM